jgi:ribosomal protein L11 methyltransferase
MMISSTATQIEPWWELRLQIPNLLCEDLSALLIEEGAMGVQTIDAQAPASVAPRGHASLGPQKHRTGQDVAESAEAWAKSLGRQPQSETGTLVASYEGTLSSAEVMTAAQETLAQLGLGDAMQSAKLVQRNDDGWAHTWKQYFKPQKLGRRLWVVPSWESTFVPPTGSVALRLDPGMAFGTGQHATTALCMRALEREIDGLSPQAKRALHILDVGCGSGILAMTALALGAGRATAVDLDPLAVTATLENMARMQMTERAQVSLTPVGELPLSYPVVVANILAPTLQIMVKELLPRVAQGGMLILSGILAEQAEAVVHTFEQASLRPGMRPVRLHERLLHEGWVAIVLRA